MKLLILLVAVLLSGCCRYCPRATIGPIMYRGGKTSRKPFPLKKYTYETKR